MEIPPDILEELKCSECKGYLSRGPVYLQLDGAAVCGVCFSHKRQATHNKQYEATAKLLLFPCKNRDLGCQHTVPFVKEAEVTGHEEVCEYRKYVCPKVSSAQCDWMGAHKDFLKHCEKQHADKVKDNPITLTHDISKSSEQTFFIRAFQLMFLLHVKICVISGKIFHTVRYLGRSEDAKTFTFKLNIKRNDDVQVTRKGQVTPQGCLSIQEDSSLAVKINSLRDMLGGFDGTTFTVTVERMVSALEKCAKCNVLITSFIYRKEDGWRCGQCSPGKVDCGNNNYCTYNDMPEKCRTHELYFCEKSNFCKLCKKTITSGTTLYEHYDSMHEREKYQSGSNWQTKWTGPDKSVHLRLCSVAGIGICRYWVDNSKLFIRLYIPVLSEQLFKFKCVVRVTQIATGHVRTYTPDTLYNDCSDWFIEVKKEEFTAWSHEFDVCVDIIQIQP